MQLFIRYNHSTRSQSCPRENGEVLTEQDLETRMCRTEGSVRQMDPVATILSHENGQLLITGKVRADRFPINAEKSKTNFRPQDS